MADQILSQEEIDALLSAMDKGEVDIKADEEKGKDKGYKTFDLTSQSVTLKEQFSVLDEVCKKLADSIKEKISGSLQRSIDVVFEGTEMVKFGEMNKSFAMPTFFNVFSMEPLFGSGLLAIEPRLVFSLIDCMFGGPGGVAEQKRDFTFIEKRMMQVFSTDILSGLEKAWEMISSIRISVKKTETRPEFLHIIDPNDFVIVIWFMLKGDTFEGKLMLGIPYLMLEPLKEKLSFKYLWEKEREHGWNVQLQKLLQGASVELVASLGGTVFSVRKLLELEVNDVIRLNEGPHTPITVSVHGVPKYMGIPGVSKGSRAVQITGRNIINGGN